MEGRDMHFMSVTQTEKFLDQKEDEPCLVSQTICKSD